MYVNGEESQEHYKLNIHTYIYIYIHVCVCVSVCVCVFYIYDTKFVEIYLNNLNSAELWFVLLLPSMTADIQNGSQSVDPLLSTFQKYQTRMEVIETDKPGNTKGGSITLPLTSCLTGLESAF